MVTPENMPIAEVLRVIRWLRDREVIYQINGGWAVDALVGAQTRPHRDLDVFMDEVHVPALVQWLGSRGYVVTEDWLPIRSEMSGSLGRIDIHPMAIDTDGNGVQRGFGNDTFQHLAAERTEGDILGVPVVVATAERLRHLHTGYEPSPIDLHDMRQLDSLEQHPRRPHR